MKRILTLAAKLKIERFVEDALGTPPKPGMRLLFRGVSKGHPSSKEAAGGRALVNGAYVGGDYEGMKLLPASYWSSEDKDISLDDPIKHAFGGDHPAGLSQAREGVVLARYFSVDSVGTDAETVDPDDVHLLYEPVEPPGKSEIAYEVFPPMIRDGLRSEFTYGGRLERLVFDEVRAEVFGVEELLQRAGVQIEDVYRLYLEELIETRTFSTGDPGRLLADLDGA